MGTIPDESLLLCFPKASQDLRWTSSCKGAFPEEFGLSFPFILDGPAVITLTLDSFQLTCPQRIDIYSGAANRNRLSTDAASSYKAAIFSLLHSETIHPPAGNMQCHSATQVQVQFMLSPGNNLLRCLVYGSGSMQNPFRMSEVLGVRCSILPTPSYFISQLSLRASPTAVYMKKYFHRMLVLHGDLSVRMLRAKGNVEEALLRYRQEYPQLSTAQELLRYQCVGDVNTWAVAHTGQLLSKVYLELIRLSIQVDRLDSEANGESAKGSINGENYTRDRSAALTYAEKIMVSLERSSECFGRIEKVTVAVSDKRTIQPEIDYAHDLAPQSYCLCCNESASKPPGPSRGVCCSRATAAGESTVAVVSWPTASIPPFPYISAVQIVDQFFVRTYTSCKDLYRDSSWTTALKKQVWLNSNHRASEKFVGELGHHAVSTIEITRRAKIHMTAIIGDFPESVMESSILPSPRLSSGAPAAPLSDTSPTDNSLAKHMFLSLWSPEMVHVREGTGCSSVKLIQWVVNPEPSGKLRCEYFLQLYRFHYTLVDVLGLEKLSLFLAHGSSTDEQHAVVSELSNSFLRGSAHENSDIFQMDSSNALCCLTVLLAHGLLGSSTFVYDSCLSAARDVFCMGGEQGTVKETEVRSSDYVSLLFSLVLFLSSAIRGALMIHGDDVNRRLVELTSVCLTLSVQEHIGKCLMVYAVSSIVYGCIDLLTFRGTASTGLKETCDSEDCCVIISVLATSLSLIDSLVNNSPVVQCGPYGTESVTFVEETYLSREAIRCLIIQCERFSGVSSVAKSLTSLRMKLHISAELLSRLESEARAAILEVKAVESLPAMPAPPLSSRKKYELREAIEKAERLKALEAERAEKEEKARLQADKLELERLHEQAAIAEALRLEAIENEKRAQLMRDILLKQELQEEARKSVLDIIDDILVDVDEVCHQKNARKLAAQLEAVIPDVKPDEIIDIPRKPEAPEDNSATVDKEMPEVAVLVPVAEIPKETALSQEAKVEKEVEVDALPAPVTANPEEPAAPPLTVVSSQSEATIGNQEPSPKLKSVTSSPSVKKPVVGVAQVPPQKTKEIKEKEMKEKRQSDLKQRLLEEKQKKEKQAAEKAKKEREEAAQKVKDEILRRKKLEAEREAKEQLELAEKRVQEAREERRQKRIAEHEEKIRLEREFVLAQAESKKLTPAEMPTETEVVVQEAEKRIETEDGKYEEQSPVPEIELVPAVSSAPQEPPPDESVPQEEEPKKESKGKDKKGDKDGCIIS